MFDVILLSGHYFWRPLGASGALLTSWGASKPSKLKPKAAVDSPAREAAKPEAGQPEVGQPEVGQRVAGPRATVRVMTVDDDP